MRPKYRMAGPTLALGLTLLLPGTAAVAQAQKLGREPKQAKQGDVIRDATCGTNLDTPLAQAEPRRRAFDIPAQDLGPELLSNAKAAAKQEHSRGQVLLCPDLGEAARDHRAMPRFEPAQRSWGDRDITQ